MKRIKILILAAGLVLTVSAAVLGNGTAKTDDAVLTSEHLGDVIRKTVDSPEMLRSIRYESFDNLFETSFSLTFDFSAHTVTAEENQSERCTAEFTEEQAKSLLQTANDCNLFGWDAYYYKDVEDGGWDNLTVAFTDGTVQTVQCINEYPPDFDILLDALFELAK